MTYYSDIRAILAVQGLPPAAKLVFIYLYDRQGGNGAAWPSLTTIGKECGGLARSTVVESLQAIEKAGLLKIERSSRPCQKITNRYSVNMTGLKIEPVKTPDWSENPTSTGTKNLPVLVGKSDPNVSLTKSINDPKAIFDNSRKIYPGRKRGLDVEFEAFKKAVNDWREVLPILEPSIRAYKAHCEHLKVTGQFCPGHKDFGRWLGGRCWEFEFEPKVLPREGVGAAVFDEQLEAWHREQIKIRSGKGGQE